MGCAGQRQLLCGEVRAFQRVVTIDRGGVRPYRFCAEGVAAQQPIPPAGGRVQRVALRGEGKRGLVDGGAAYAQRFRQLLAGDVAALCSGKGLQQSLFCALRHGLSLLKLLS